jgi:hypothetical protein
MTTADVKVTPGTGANVATYSISEDAETKQIQRVGLNSLGGADLTDATGIKISTSQIGTLGQTTMSASVPVTIANNQATISFAQDTTQLAKGPTGTFVTPVSVAVVASASGATAVVAAQGSGNKIRVVQWDVKVNAAVNFKWQSAANDLTGLYYNSSQGDGVARSFSPIGYFTTNANEALNINLSGAVAVGGALTYVVVT